MEDEISDMQHCTIGGNIHWSFSVYVSFSV